MNNFLCKIRLLNHFDKEGLISGNLENHEISIDGSVGKLRLLATESSFHFATQKVTWKSAIWLRYSPAIANCEYPQKAFALSPKANAHPNHQYAKAPITVFIFEL